MAVRWSYGKAKRAGSFWRYGKAKFLRVYVIPSTGGLVAHYYRNFLAGDKL